MMENLEHLKTCVQKISGEEYFKGAKSLTHFDLFSGSQNKKRASTATGHRDLPIKILDQLIALEERGLQGFSLYNRGDNLKESLINPERVREFIN